MGGHLWMSCTTAERKWDTLRETPCHQQITLLQGHKRLHQIFVNLLQAIELPGGTYDKGLIPTEPDYKPAHVGITFDLLDTPLEA